MYKDIQVVHIVACTLDGGIGYKDEMLYRIPPDLQHFKNTTMGQVCLVGRVTAEKLPDLPNRHLIVVSSHNPLEDALEQAYSRACELGLSGIYVIGGEKLYNSTASIVDRIVMTRIQSHTEADAHYHLPVGIFSVKKLRHIPHGKSHPNCSIMQFIRQTNITL